MSTPRAQASFAAAAEKKLFLRLERKELDRISALLALHPGEIPVYLHIPEEKITLLCPRKEWCSGDEECLRKLPPEVVRIKRKSDADTINRAVADARSDAIRIITKAVMFVKSNPSHS